MSITISRLIHALRQECNAVSRDLRPGPAEQLVAAALGFNTLAAYQAAITAGDEPRLIDDADHLVLDTPLMRERALHLGVGFDDIPQLLADAARSLLTRTTVHLSVSALEDFVHSRLMFDAANGNATSGAIAQTNPDGIDEIYLPFDLDINDADLGEPHLIEIEGHMNMGIDTERPYFGHHIDVKASITFTRIGRALVNDLSAGIDEAKLDYDW